ncbi:MAG: hypothetical protein KJO80_16390 [Gammaproteobacteria bacterium]|nr:hypothetical protein [Gammaproteobacteria bacterium]
MIKKRPRPGFKVVFGFLRKDHGFRKTLPFKRSWVGIAVLAAMAAAFMFPAVTTFKQAMTEWGSLDSLFDLVAALFLSAWLLGWMIAPLIMTGILLLLLCGREVLQASPGRVEIFMGIPFVGISRRFDPARMRNLRLERPLRKSGTAWRGPHLLFDYDHETIALGSAIDGYEIGALRSQIEAATGTRIRRGDAPPDETSMTPEAVEELPAQAAAPDAGHQLRANPLSLGSPSTLVLITANLVPVAGFFFLGWNLADVMVLYWAESAVIGFFNICKIIVIGRWKALFAAPFFAGHFGGFMAVHFLFIYTLFVEPSQTGSASGDSLAEVAELFVVLWPALLALFISHAFSFFTNFLSRREYSGKTVNDQMTEPYGRIIFMHLVLIFGGGLSMVLGNPAPVLLIVLVLKISFDVRAHLKQHSGKPVMKV